jgi:hypothetical protein
MFTGQLLYGLAVLILPQYVVVAVMMVMMVMILMLMVLPMMFMIITITTTMMTRLQQTLFSFTHSSPSFSRQILIGSYILQQYAQVRPQQRHQPEQPWAPSRIVQCSIAVRVSVVVNGVYVDP